MSSMLFPQPPFFKTYRNLVDRHLDQILRSEKKTASRLSAAMQHSTLIGGKRVRPILTLSTAHCFGVSSGIALIPACAVELIHAYSLIHDDLPSMDDDDLRRGQPTCHIAFDEATAILAGDALQALAFELLSDASLSISAECQLKMLRSLAGASGRQGMVAGQSIDLESVGETLSLEQLETMHQLKTGALIQSAIELGALCAADVKEQELKQLRLFARAIGLGFQVQDDILDITSETSVLGKQQGADQNMNKPTYPALLGLDGAKDKLKTLHQEACDALDRIDNRDTSTLKLVADYIVTRVF